MPLIIIPIILAVVVGFSSGYITVDLSGSANQQEKTQEQQIPLADTKVIEKTPSPTPTTTPIPTSKPQVVYKQPEPTQNPTKSDPNSDPIIKCNWVKGSKCEGQYLNIKKSECAKGGIYVCCQVGSDWKLLNKNDCSIAQSNIKFVKPRPDLNTNKAEIKNLPLYTPSPQEQAFLDEWSKKLDKEKAELDQLSEKIFTPEQNPEYKKGNDEVYYGRDTRLKDEREQRKATGAMPEYGSVKQDVIYGRDDRR